MQYLLTEQQKARHGDFKTFVNQNVEPFAEKWDREQRLPESVIALLAKLGYLGCSLPTQNGGHGWDTVTFGLLNEALGRGSSSLNGVLTVQTMVSKALLKWGSVEQIRKWIPMLAQGEIIGAFALTEPGGGSDIHSLVTEFTDSRGDSLVLNGAKKWISCGQFASLFLVFGKLGDRSLACLVPRETPGLEVEPIHDLMGFRAAGLAKLTFNNVEVPPANVVGKPGFALSHIAPVGLHYGRISTACSALGLLRGCFEESVTWAATRKIGNQPLGDIGMIRSLIAEMGTDLEAGSFLCHSACRAADENLPEAFEKALMAKYFTSRAAVRAASDAVQIQGAAGCHASSSVSRFYRDAKIMEIIEGTTQIHEHLLGGIFLGQVRRSLQ
ncbi:MAG: acyl-CoA dehydrogenase [Acidobacteria bacterium]|nr:MAG: acyl-CoA dehydrogenase [Acidobacteriota bacterium]